MSNAYKVLNALLRTEKGSVQAQLNQYLFSVKRDANKIEIKKAVEEIYKVKVKSVNTVLMPGKFRRVRYQLGKTPDWKKAIVTLQVGQTINLS